MSKWVFAELGQVSSNMAAAKTKNGKEHTVPLSPLALQELKR